MNDGPLGIFWCVPSCPNLNGSQLLVVLCGEWKFNSHLQIIHLEHIHAYRAAHEDGQDGPDIILYYSATPFTCVVGLYSKGGLAQDKGFAIVHSLPFVWPFNWDVRYWVPPPMVHISSPHCYPRMCEFAEIKEPKENVFKASLDSKKLRYLFIYNFMDKNILKFIPWNPFYRELSHLVPFATGHHTDQWPVMYSSLCNNCRIINIIFCPSFQLSISLVRSSTFRSRFPENVFVLIWPPPPPSSSYS